MKNAFKMMLVAFVAVVLGGCATVNNENQAKAKNELLSKGITFDAKTFVKEAAEGNLDNVKLFVDGGMNPNTAVDETALSAAAYHSHLDVVEYLVSVGASISTSSFHTDPIISAVRGGNYDIADFLIKNGADVNSIGYDKATPLYVAAEMGKPAIAELLIKKGANVGYIQPWTGLTPLAVCAKSPYGSKATLEQLVKGGSNVNYKTPTGMSVLGWTILRQKFDCIKFLLDNGADAREGYPEDYASRAVLGAIAWGNPDTIKLLLDHGVNINAKAFGKIPLVIWCAKNLREKVALLLIDLGADTNIVYNGKSLLDFAVANREAKLVKKLDPGYNLNNLKEQIIDPNIEAREEQMDNMIGGSYFTANSKTVTKAVEQAVKTNEAVNAVAQAQGNSAEGIVTSKPQGNVAEEKSISDLLAKSASEENKNSEEGYAYPVDQEKLEREIDAEIKKIEQKYSTNTISDSKENELEREETYQPDTTPTPKTEEDIYSGTGNVPIDKAIPVYVDPELQQKAQNVKPDPSMK